ncbi:MAG: peptidylprolyl isomerase [Candidatus Sedimenticola sp. (ex Thyasira tokunagai)]
MTIDVNKAVSLAYTLTDNEGTIIDQSTDGSFEYLHGASNIIPGLESALAGKKVGDKLGVAVEPADGYGERNEEMIQVVGRDMFNPEDEINPGMQFQAQSPDGHMMMVTVVEVTDESVTIDGNHPLAGVNLNFDVEVMGLRDATAEEIEHGHIHSPDGHDH